MRNSTVNESIKLKLPKTKTSIGNRISICNLECLPFEIKRVYYLYDVPGGESRGGHAHMNLQQLVIAASGSFDLIIDDSINRRTFHLYRPDEGLFIPSGLWRELHNFSSGAISLVLASSIYDAHDYIRSYKKYVKYKEH